MPLRVSQHLVERAAEAFRSGKTLKSADDFEIFEMPDRRNGDPDTRVLFLWKEGRDFPKFPTGFLLPVSIESRRGYLWNRAMALAYEIPAE
ncbi:MAG: hypothetical protein ABIK65_01275 [Candidatus Eisenbacteria bacterium]